MSTEDGRLEHILARVGLAAVAGTAALWALVSLWWPYGWDQGAYGYVADVVHAGGIPYRDVWDPKGPLVPYLFAALQFGEQMWAIRLFDLIVLGASCWWGARIVAMFAGRIAAASAVAMMVLAFGSFGNWYTAQPDGWGAHALVVAVALLVLPGASARRAATASAVIGACTLMKPTYAIFGLLVVIALWPAERADRAKATRAAALSAVAFLVPIAVAATWFGAHGALSDLIDIHFRVNLERRATDPNMQLSTAKIAQLCLAIFLNVPDLALALPGAALGAVTALRERRRVGLILVVWLLLAAVSLGAQRKFLFHNYSWHIVYPPVALLAGIGLGRLWQDAASAPALRSLRALVVATWAIVFYQTAKVPLVQAGTWLRYASGRISLEQYRASFEGPLPFLNGTPVETIGFSVTRDIRLGAYLRERTREDQEIFIWSDAFVNHLSGRRSMTPITAPGAFTLWGTDERRQKYRAELLQAITSERAAIIGVPRVARALEGSPEFSIPLGFPDLAAALATGYDDVGPFEDVELYERKHLRL